MSFGKQVGMVLLLGVAAWGCSCLPTNGCPGLGNADGPKFLGTVISVDAVPQGPTRLNLNQRKARIRVTERFGGLDEGVAEVEVYTGSNSGDCGIDFSPGATYLVGARRDRDGTQRAGLCGSTRPMPGGETLLAVLRRERDGEKLPSLTGQVTLLERDFQGRIGLREPRVIGNVRVRLRSGQRVIETTADGAGVFQFFDVPGGRYRFDPALPAGMQLSWDIERDEPAWDFEVHATGCQVADLDVFPSGSISGRVVGAMRVYVVPVGDRENRGRHERYSVRVQKDGAFSVVHLQDGEYVLTVDPGKLSSGQMVRVRGGEAVKGVDFVVR